MLSNQKTNPHDLTGGNRLLIFLAFSCIYVIWGSTYLAIRYAVETIPPLFVAGFRHLIAGALLFGWCWWRGFRPIRQQWLASIVLAVLFFLIGAASWSIGMVYSRSAALHPDPRMAAAMSLLAGAGMLLLGGAVTGEAARLELTAVSLRSLLALGYLAVAGSLLAYSAYFWLLDRFPPTLVATHTYVNPVVALILGWAIAGEVLTARFLFGGLIVIAAISLVSRAT